MQAGLIGDWFGKKWKTFLERRKAHAFAGLLVRIRAMEPKVLGYLETLEGRVESQERELRALRWALKGEQLGHWDEEQDIREWKNRRAGADTPRPE